MNGISRDTYAEMDDTSKLNVLFDYAKDNHDCVCRLDTRMERLERKVERGRKRDAVVSSGSGLIGGFLAVLAYLFGWAK